MSKDSKTEIKTAELTAVEKSPVGQIVDPSVLAAINTAVSVAMKEAVGTIVQQLKPATVPQTLAPSIPVPNAGAPTSSVPAASTSYVSKLQGIPVQERQDLRHVHPSVIQQWFNKVETRWKDNYNKKKVGGSPVDLSWTRG